MESMELLTAGGPLGYISALALKRLYPTKSSNDINICVN